VLCCIFFCCHGSDHVTLGECTIYTNGGHILYGLEHTYVRPCVRMHAAIEHAPLRGNIGSSGWYGVVLAVRRVVVHCCAEECVGM
jgi:hypothetical protein